MKKITWAALVTTILIGFTQCVVKKAKEEKKDDNKTSVWKISKGGKSAYLGGTVHILRKQDYPLPAAFMQAYNDAKLVVFETDTKAVNDPTVAQSMMQKGMLEGEETLVDILDTEAFELIEVEASKSQLPIEMIIRLKPGLAVTTLSAMYMQKMGMTQEGVDAFFTKKAIADKKELGQLESVESQIDRIVEMGQDNPSQFVKYSMRDLKDMDADMGGLIANWKFGNSTEMLKQIVAMQKDYGTMYKSLLVQRNNNWMPQIENFIKNEAKAFILVGTLHLYGPDGLLELLKKRGYKIEQL